MLTCDSVRDELALSPASEDSAVREHLEQCSACAAYQRKHSALDVVLRGEMRWEAPSALSDRLLALAATMPLGLDAPATPALMERPRPKGWHVTLAYVLTALAIGLSMAVVWSVGSTLVGTLGVQAFLAQLQALPAQLAAQLTTALPESRFAVAFFLYVRDKLLWLLLAAVLWAVLDKWNPQISFGGRQQRA
jgi:anti-sigma factor RsiW